MTRQPTYATVKEFAERAGVTTQAIYKRLPTDLKEYTIQGKKGKLINIKALRLFEVLEPDSIMQPVEQPTDNLLTDILKNQLDTLNMQLELKDKQIEMLSKALEESIKLSTSLQDQIQLSLDEPESIEEETFKKWYQFWK